MSVFCEAVVALGLGFFGACNDAPSQQMSLPDEDQDVWAYVKPIPPPPPAPAPAPIVAVIPNFPPVIIREVVEKVVLPPIQVPEPVVVVTPPPKPDPYRLWIEATVNARRAVPVRHPLPQNIETTDGTQQLAAIGNVNSGASSFKAPDVEKYDSQGRTSTKPVDNARIIGQDRYITGILETGINSQLGSAEGGQIIIQTARNIFGYHGRNILIPKGSRLICDYETPEDFGSSRLSIQCDRILLAGHRAEIIQLDAPVGDMQGRGGISGEVYKRYGEKYGMAFLIAGLSASVRGASAALTNSSDDNSSVGSIADEASQELSQKLGEITASVLEQTINLAPIITVAQGTRVQIRPKHDWYIAKFKEGNS